MRLKDAVQKLRDSGHTVTYRVRYDGGIAIKTVDGIRFQAREGSDYVRALAGASVSEKFYSQRRAASIQGVEAARINKTLRAPSLTIRKGDSKKVRREKNKTKQALRQARKYQTIHKSELAKKLRREGFKGTISSLRNIARKQAGLCYEGQVEDLASYALDVFTECGYEGHGYEVESKLENVKKTFSNDYLKSIYQELYLIQKEAKSGTLNDSTEWSHYMIIRSLIKEGFVEGKRIYQEMFRK